MLLSTRNNISLMALIFLSYVTHASAQNIMGDIDKNSGIITQGQLGNNYILQGMMPPSVQFVRDLETAKDSDGVFTKSVLIRIISQTPANALIAAVRVEDVVNGDPPMGPGPVGRAFNVNPTGSGVTMGSSWEADGWYYQRIQAPAAGDYIVRARVASESAKPHVGIALQ
jgi:hypothetical protein